jgi:erythromycin esterase-like protein
MMPDTVDRQIEAARARFEELDRRLARAQRSRPNAAATIQLRRQRDQARADLLALVCLAETTADEMGWA